MKDRLCNFFCKPSLASVQALWLCLWGLGCACQLGAAEDARALLDRTLQANRRWLDPSPIQGSYYLSIQFTEEPTVRKTGAFSLSTTGQVASGRSMRTSASRVGSEIWTPLHNILHDHTPYTLTLEGPTNVNGTPVLALEVEFAGRVRNQIGFGGQYSSGAKVNYSHEDYMVETARLLIEPVQAIPLMIETHIWPTNGVIDVSWQFETNYFATDGGFAPRGLEWYNPAFVREQQDFQLFQNEWIFQKGQSWWLPGNPFGRTGMVLSAELVDLEIPFPRLAFQQSSATPILSWPTYGRTGIILESADNPQGPWSAVLTQAGYDITNAIVSIPTTRLGQFYRLRQ